MSTERPLFYLHSGAASNSVCSKTSISISRKEIHDFFQTHYPLYKRSENLKLAILCLYTYRSCYIKLIQTKRKLFVCGLLDMLIFEETRLLIELRKKLLMKEKKTDSRSHAFFGPKTFNCQICISSLVKRMG